MTKKKSSLGRIIFILILLLILIGGGYFGYQYYTKEKFDIENLQSLLSGINPEIEKEFPIAGIWYLDNPSVSSEYIFESPRKTDGKITGKLNIVVDKISTSVLDYEVIGGNKLKISDSENKVVPYEMIYSYSAAEQKLEINIDAEKRIYTRNAPIAIQKTEENEQKSPQQLMMEKMEQIADIEWNAEEAKLIPGTKYAFKFSKPILEGNTINGEFQIHHISNSSELFTYGKYELVSADEMKVDYIKRLYDDGREQILNTSETIKWDVLDNGNTLIMNSYKYIR